MSEIMNPDVDAIISEATARTIEPDARREVSGGISPVIWMARSGMLVAPWWSKRRDLNLRTYVKGSDHVSGAVYNMQAKMRTIPFRVIAVDQSIKEHVNQAERETTILRDTAELGAGWGTFYGKWVEEVLTQDNGTFAELIGPGDTAGPIIGRPLTVRHLDSWRCQRTGNAEFPVLYQNTDGKQYKLHYTRVLYDAQMSSPIAEMFGVGFCAVSRCVNIAQTLMDVITFKQEKLGSRPHRAIIVPHGGLDPDDIQEAFQLAEQGLDAQGLSRYSKIVVAGSSTLQEAGLNVYELSTLPDGFDEEKSTVLGMATIALAFGMDARELFPAMQSGATRADALLQHLKQRGKGPGEILEMTERLFNQKYLPAHLKLVFDFQDDAQDKMVAEVKKVRSDGRIQDLDSGAINVRIAREHMLESGDLTKSQFARLELMDGRLEDGTTVLALFYSENKKIKKYLDLGMSDPMDTESNDLEAMGVLIREKTAEVNKAIVNAKTESDRFVAFQALMALIYLEKHYQDPQSTIDVMLGRADKEPVGEMPESRVRTKNPADPSRDEADGEKRSTNIDHPDDRPA